jgi:hypothetical protein
MSRIGAGHASLALGLGLLLGACAASPEGSGPEGSGSWTGRSAAADLPATVLQDALETLRSGEAVRWRLADSERGGTVQPVRTFRTAQGFCREYAVTLTEPDGSGSAWREVACRDPSGVWQAMANGA